MNRLSFRIVTLILLVGLLAAAVPVTASAQEGTLLKVVAARANVRLKPDLGSPVIGQVAKGTILESTGKVGDWYAVNLPPDEDGIVVSGYLHLSTVEVTSDAGEAAEAAEPPPAPRARTSPPARPARVETEEVAPSEPVYRERYGRAKIVSGSFLKFGWMTTPDAGGFSNAWLASFGFDMGLGRNVGVGLEIQPAIRSYSDIDLKMIPIMGFVNLKAGLNLGDLLPVLKIFNVVGGGGLGAEAVFSSIGVDGGKTITDFKVNFAFHLLGGLELDLGSLRLLAEYQLAQVSDSAVDTSGFRHYLLFGLRF
jgi:hypothetical protein